ncbi:MAG: hypothetical protein M1480_16950, partial [Bacteroidetes bacterium]|nr:hypothetical protein [Bacteroidota bacterium]
MNLKSPPRTAEENKIFYFLIIAIVLLFIVFEYLLFHNGFFAISLDESGHTLEAYDWFKGNGQLFSGWLPFQKIVYAFAFRIYYDLFLTPRIISAIFGLFTLLSLIDLSFQL